MLIFEERRQCRQANTGILNSCLQVLLQITPMRVGCGCRHVIWRNAGSFWLLLLFQSLSYGLLACCFDLCCHHCDRYCWSVGERNCTLQACHPQVCGRLQASWLVLRGQAWAPLQATCHPQAAFHPLRPPPRLPEGFPRMTPQTTSQCHSEFLAQRTAEAHVRPSTWPPGHNCCGCEGQGAQSMPITSCRPQAASHLCRPLPRPPDDVTHSGNHIFIHLGTRWTSGSGIASKCLPPHYETCKQFQSDSSVSILLENVVAHQTACPSDHTHCGCEEAGAWL